ncbi:hypothetical protein SteCoe_25083 [Stentor coeruleus]|uniref:Uncharacterized protein n=1 Tax=Stentor coeruleus TaxID=5963 RepID=A0A1R2BG51_9CILI|nr:hypothetical protein SteCoe_25083 [Stentor coeruleus]
MSSIICCSCLGSATQCCKCEGFEKYFCQIHINDHLKIEKEHVVSSLQKRSGKSFSKVCLFNRIQEIIKESNKIITRIVEHSESLTANVQSSAAYHINQLMSFIRSCKKTLKELEKCSELKVNVKNIIPPYQACITDKEPEVFKHIQCPRVKLNKFNSVLIELSLPAFPHCLFNYSFQSACVIKGNSLNLHPGKEKKIQTNLTFNGRMLSISKNEIMFTGNYPASNSAQIINIETGIVTILPCFNQKRYWHSMTWINDRPAILGGRIDENDDSLLSSVEIYDECEWECLPNMKIPKDSFSAINVFKVVYTFGGSNHEKLNIIEKFEFNEWELLSVQIPNELTGIGLISMGDMILLLGGRNSNKNIEKKSYFFDTIHQTFSECFYLDESFCFSNPTMWYIGDNEISNYGQNQKKFNIAKLNIIAS